MRLFLLSCCVLLSSCGSKNPIFNGEFTRIEQFEIVAKLTAEKVPIECIGAFSVEIIDTLLFVKYAGEPQHYFSVYNIPNYHYYKNILTRGRGPNEYLSANYFGQCDENNGISMYILDRNKARLTKFDVSKSIATGTDVIEMEVNVSRDYYPIFMRDNGQLLYKKFDLSEQVIAYNKGDAKGTSETPMNRVFDHVLPENQDKLISVDYYNSQKEKVVMSMFMLDQINILDLSTNTNKYITTSGNSPRWDEIKSRNNADLSIYYTCTRITDNHIFSLHMNQPLQDWQKVEKSVEIHVLDWEGNGVANLKLDEYIQYFAIDRINNELYGIDANETIYRYNLPDELQ